MGAGREGVGPGTMVRCKRKGSDVGAGRANEGGMGTEVANAGETGTEGEVGVEGLCADGVDVEGAAALLLLLLRLLLRCCGCCHGCCCCCCCESSIGCSTTFATASVSARLSCVPSCSSFRRSWCPVGGSGVCVSRGGGGGSGGGRGGAYSPGDASFTRRLTVNVPAYMASCSPSPSTRLPCLTRAEGGGVGSPCAPSISPAGSPCSFVSSPSSPASMYPPRRLSSWVWPSVWSSSSLDDVGAGVRDVARSCWTRSDGGDGCGLELRWVVFEVERDVLELRCWGSELAIRLAAWYLSYRMTSSVSASLCIWSFLAFSLSRASCSSTGPVLSSFEVGFRLPLKAGMKRGELAPKHELSKVGMSRELFR
jgi:hypothetical protein